MAALRRLLTARNLTDLWLVLPEWLFRLIQRWLGVSDEALHEWLCDALGCRCPDEGVPA